MDRNNISQEYKWNLSDIYASWEDWEADLNRLEPLADKLVQLKGRLSESASVVEEAYRLAETIGRIMVKVGSYTHLYFDLDQRETEINSHSNDPN